MPIAKKIFPFGNSNQDSQTLRILLVAEGFKSEDKRVFLEACHEFADQLLQYTPFNHLRIATGALNIFYHFVPSANQGPAIDEPATTDRTAFESSLDTGAQTLSFSLERINEQLTDLQLLEIDEFDEEDSLSEEDEEHQAGSLIHFDHFFEKALLVFLLPASDRYPQGAELEFIPSDFKLDSYFIATTLTGYWHQVIIRAVCKLLGLGDEFIIEEPSFTNPSHEVSHAIDHTYFNLVTNIVNPPTEDFKWHSILTAVRQNRTLDIESHPNSNIFTSNLLIPPNNIALWEGGGGYQTGVYRSAKDCLMRRKIGDKNLPLREAVVPLCPVCEYYVRKIIVPFF